MAQHRVYRAIAAAIRSGRLTEPFGRAEFRRACPGFGKGTYQAFLSKHSKGNGKTTELFERVSKGRYRLIRPFRYEDYFDTVSLNSIQIGVAEANRGEIEPAHPIEVRDQIKSIWHPAFIPPLYHLPEPKWYIGLTDQFVKDIQNLDRKLQGRILQVINQLAADPTAAKGDTIKPLIADLKGLWRYRIGDYRLVYMFEADKQLITLIAFSSRGGVYE